MSMRVFAGWIAVMLLAYVVTCNFFGIPHHLGFIHACIDFACGPIDDFLHRYALLR